MARFLSFFSLVIYVTFIDLSAGFAAIGNSTASFDDAARSVVRIRFLRDGKFVGACTGVILAEDVVELAGHCQQDHGANATSIEFIDPDTGLVQMRPAIFRKGIDPLAGKSVRDFQWTGIFWAGGDLRILIFAGGLPVGFHVANILPENVRIQEGSRLQVYGYGLHRNVFELAKLTAEQTGQLLDNVLRVSHVIIVSEKPYSVMDTRSISDRVNYGDHDAIGFHVDSPIFEKLCEGDSGAPAFISLDGLSYLVGSLTALRPDSFGLPCGTAGTLLNLLSYSRDKNEPTVPGPSSSLENLILNQRELVK